MKDVCIRLKNQQIKVASDQTLLQVIQEQGIKLDAPCGGRKKCGKCKVLVNGKEVLACDTKPTEGMDISIPGPKEEKILGLASDPQAISKKNLLNLGLAVDIGTTTVVLCLIDLDTESVVLTEGFANPQRTFGADITSRIRYVKDEGQEGLMRCQKALVKEMNNGIVKMTHKLGLTPEFIKRTVISGNTTMLHLFRGLSPVSMGEAPYEPLFVEDVSLDAKDIELQCSGQVLLLPSISAFIGADIVAGVGYTHMEQQKSLNLLVDLGTNGEMVFGNKFKLMGCSTAVGPAFEGVNMSYGMPAIEGAIREITTHQDKLSYDVIGGGVPKGICGSGYISLISYLLHKGKIDETGRLVDGDFKVAQDVYLTQEDVRQFQMAKGAVRAGMESLLAAYGMDDFDFVNTLYLAGGFGNYLPLEDAYTTGLLPEEIKGRVELVGNTALIGAKEVLLHPEHLHNLKEIATKVDVIDLAIEDTFKDLFIKRMSFK